MMSHLTGTSSEGALKVSVVVPVRDEEHSIRVLLDGLLKQTLPPDEIVITDGGSADKTRSIIDGYVRNGAPVKLITENDSLPGRSRNLAAAEARNAWIAFIDAGIEPSPGWLAALSEKTNGADVVYGSYEPVTDSFFRECAAIAYVSPATMTKEGPVRPPSIASALMRKTVWETVGGFPENLRSAEDLLFMRKIAQSQFTVRRAPEAVVYWTIQPNLPATFKRFMAYSRNNIRAGLFAEWQRMIFIYYALIAFSAIAYLAFGLAGFLGPPILWLLFLITRGLKALHRNRSGYPASYARNFARICLLVPIFAVLDAAAIIGSIGWLLGDKLHLTQTGEPDVARE